MKRLHINLGVADLDKSIRFYTGLFAATPVPEPLAHACCEPGRAPAVADRTVVNVLFLCTGNSARSILAEAILNDLGAGRFRAYSAGSHPKGAVHVDTIALLARRGHSTDGLRSKSWDEFARPGAPPIDLVVTVCDNAQSEPCPVWPGRPAMAHWGVPDPAAIADTALRRATFEDAYRRLRRRIEALIAGPAEGGDAAIAGSEADAGRTV